ncbi:MAG: hypothetical protein JNK87_00530 [Bryobacterales bacterium]|nr:hypothetical protein [Bryobacterales bacterium]
MSTFGPWFFDVEVQPNSFASVGQVTIDFTAPDASGNGGSFSFTYSPDNNGTPIGPISMTPVRTDDVNGKATYLMSGALTPNLVIPAPDPDAGTYVRANLYFIPDNIALWGTLFENPSGIITREPEVNVEASSNPPVPVDLKQAVLKATAKANSY